MNALLSIANCKPHYYIGILGWKLQEELYTEATGNRKAPSFPEAFSCYASFHLTVSPDSWKGRPPSGIS